MYPYIDNRQHGKFADELRRETLGIWQESIHFFNALMRTVDFFPETDSFQLKEKIQDAALTISDWIAKAAYSKSRESYEHYLKEAKEAIAATSASLYIAHKWDYVPKGMYNHLFEESAQLSKKLDGFSQYSNFSDTQLN